MNGTPLSADAADIQTMSDTITGRKLNELPCIKFVPKFRVVVQNMNYTLAALRLVDSYEWHQLFTDGTSRRHIALKNLVIAVMVDSKLDPVICSSCILLEDETSNNQFKSIVKQVR